MGNLVLRYLESAGILLLIWANLVYAGGDKTLPPKIVGRTIGSFLSPGPLGGPHKEWEGINNCTRCHNLVGGITNEKCLHCHEEIRASLSKRLSYHFRFQGKRCWQCHSDHKGEAYDLLNFDQDKFSHDKETAYMLDGRHREVKCEKCHPQKKGPDYLGTLGQCKGCHPDKHKGKYSQSNCAICHGIEGWAPQRGFWEKDGFDHSRFRFLLEGKHQIVDCKSCHLVKGKMVYKDIPNGCSSCHSNPHKAKISSPCQPCHTPQTWQPNKEFWLSIRFDHAKLSYPLEGKHVEVDCARCHRQNKWTEIPYKNCISCHEDKHRDQFGKRDCRECHQLDGWKPSTYDEQRHKEARYVLDKLHSLLECQKCHQKDQYTPLPLTCPDCHAGSARFYQGTYGAGLIPSQPDLMSKSVACPDCHKELPGTNPMIEIKKQCQECHNPNYVKWFEAWEGILTEKESEIEVLLKTNGNVKPTPGRDPNKVKEIYEIVKKEKYHNPLYAYDLLDYCLRQLQ
jgi:hypothetical protein